jgi:hypothetical protein
MTTDQVAHFSRRFFPAESNVDIMKSEAPIFPKDKPSAETQRVSKRKCRP